MRLTNVARMGLPHGRFHSYSVTAGSPGRPVPVSFDQERHLQLGERAGSWMAIALRLPETTTRERLGEAWLAVVRRHGTLHSVFTRSTDGSPLLHDVDVAAGEWHEHEVARGRLTRDVLREVLDATCTPYAAPSHQLCVVDSDDGRPVVVIGSDHAHVDMWSLLIVVRDLLDELGRDVGAAAAPRARGFEEHTAELAVRPRAPQTVRAALGRDPGGVRGSDALLPVAAG